jgi:hypothetical protein
MGITCHVAAVYVAACIAQVLAQALDKYGFKDTFVVLLSRKYALKALPGCSHPASG